MSETEIDAFVSYVDELLKATSDGRIKWASVNPTTFMWDRPAPTPARLFLQRVEQTVPSTKVVGGVRVPGVEKRNLQILSVNDMSGGGMNVSIHGGQDPRINEKLGAIYDSISVGIVDKRLDFLKKTLPT